MQLKQASLVPLAASGVAAQLASNTTSNVNVPSGCSLAAGTTATSQAQLDAYAGCSTLVGDLTISGDLGNAALSGVTVIDGSLIINNATELGSFAADTLQRITGTLRLQGLTILSTASFGQLSQVDTIELITLPGISTFTTRLNTVRNIVISDTSLESIEGFTDLSSVGLFNINNNRYLSSIESSLHTISDGLTVSSNGQDLDVVFDNLVWANNITLTGVQEVSFENLQAVNGSLGFSNNTISNIRMNSLSTVGETFTIANNEDLLGVAFGNLTSVGGGFVVVNNTQLMDINFPRLETIGGDLNVIGKFNQLDLTSLKSVRGGADVETTATNYSCDALRRLQSRGYIQGDTFVCKNGAASSSMSLSSGSSSTMSGSATASGSASASGSATASASGSATMSSGSSSSSTDTRSHSRDHRDAGVQLVPGTTFFGLVAAVAAALL